MLGGEVMKKRIIAALLCVVMLFGTNGCRMLNSSDTIKATPNPSATPKADTIDPFLLKYINNTKVTENLYIVVVYTDKGYGTGVIDLNTKEEIIETVYDDMDYGFDENGDAIFIAQDIDAFVFFDKEGNLLNELYGYNRIEITDDSAVAMRAWTDQGACKIINSRGEIIFEGNGYDSIIYDEVNEKYIVGKNGLYGAATLEGEIVIPIMYNEMRPGARKYEYIVMYNGGYGVINELNNPTVDFIYKGIVPIDYVVDGVEGRYYQAVRLDGNVGIIDAYNNLVSDFVAYSNKTVTGE